MRPDHPNVSTTRPKAAIEAHVTMLRRNLGNVTVAADLFNLLSGPPQRWWAPTWAVWVASHLARRRAVLTGRVVSFTLAYVAAEAFIPTSAAGHVAVVGGGVLLFEVAYFIVLGLAQHLTRPVRPPTAAGRYLVAEAWLALRTLEQDPNAADVVARARDALRGIVSSCDALPAQTSADQVDEHLLTFVALLTHAAEISTAPPRGA